MNEITERYSATIAPAQRKKSFGVVFDVFIAGVVSICAGLYHFDQSLRCCINDEEAYERNDRVKTSIAGLFEFSLLLALTKKGVGGCAVTDLIAALKKVGRDAPSHAQVAICLDRLISAGYVTSAGIREPRPVRGGRRQRLFRLTEGGETQTVALLQQLVGLSSPDATPGIQNESHQ